MTSAPLVHDIAALERTSLAWERTGFSLAGLGTLLLKVTPAWSIGTAAGLALVASAVAIVLVLGPLGYGRARACVVAAAAAGVPLSSVTIEDPARRWVLLVTALVVTVAGAAVSVELVAHALTRL